MTSHVDAIGALTVLVQTIRPSWDTRAIRPVLEDLADRDLGDLAYAAIRTAQDHTKRRPAAIAFDSEHWRATVRDFETAAEARARLQSQLDGRLERERDLARQTDDERAARAARLAAQARAAIRPTVSHETPDTEETR